MELATIPANEQERLKALYAYHILDTLPEKDFDDIVAIAAQICGTPISHISIIDKDRIWLKSQIGLSYGEGSPREFSFCAHAINKPDEVMIVPDSSKDERFYDNPYVVDEPYVTFYAGVPLVSETGNAIGTLCVLDKVPRELTKSQQGSLRALANQVVTQLELRKKNHELALSRFSVEAINEELENFANVVAHDLKSPCNNFIALSELLLHNNAEQLDEEGREIIHYIGDAAQKLKQLIDDILKYSKSFNISQESMNDFTFDELMKEMISMLQIPPRFKLEYNGPEQLIYTSKAALLQIILNLCTNAIRYNDKEEGLVTVSFTDKDGYYEFIVADNGRGIEKVNFKKIFETAFTTQTGNDMFNTGAQGIGLSTVSRLVKKLGGEISLESEVGKGTTFTFTIKK